MKLERYFFVLLIPFLFFSCNSSKTQKPVETVPDKVEYPVGYIADYIHADLNDETELYPIQELFLESFLQKYDQYEGAHPTIITDFPETWGVVLVERLSEGRELYQIQSLSREWIFLVITSGFGTQRILDILPVALDLAIQTPDILETEIWTTERETDGTFSVTKKYEWKRSLENVTQATYEANPENYFRKKTITDQYFINSSCRFERMVSEELTEYSAIVFYYTEEKPEDWDEIIPQLEAMCEDYSILNVIAYIDFDKVELYDYKLNYITDLDITPYMEFSQGVIFMKKGETPKTVPFGSYERIRSEVVRHFKLVEG